MSQPRCTRSFRSWAPPFTVIDLLRLCPAKLYCLPVQMAGRSGRAGAGLLDNSPLDESFVVPALVRFNGHPEVDDAGNLIYTFPDLQASSREQVRRFFACSPPSHPFSVRVVHRRAISWLSNRVPA